MATRTGARVCFALIAGRAWFTVQRALDDGWTIKATGKRCPWLYATVDGDVASIITGSLMWMVGWSWNVKEVP